MAWVLLIISAVLEAVWATALEASHGFTELVPSIVFLVTIVASMIGLERAARTIPISTAYAVWAGLGAALTVTWAIATGVQAFSWWTVLCIVGIVGAVVGLKRTGHSTDETTTSNSASSSASTTSTASSQ